MSALSPTIFSFSYHPLEKDEISLLTIIKENKEIITFHDQGKFMFLKKVLREYYEITLPRKKNDLEDNHKENVLRAAVVGEMSELTKGKFDYEFWEIDEEKTGEQITLKFHCCVDPTKFLSQ